MFYMIWIISELSLTKGSTGQKSISNQKQHTLLLHTPLYEYHKMQNLQKENLLKRMIATGAQIIYGRAILAFQFV